MADIDGVRPIVVSCSNLTSNKLTLHFTE